jgi:hypothetical protein
MEFCEHCSSSGASPSAPSLGHRHRLRLMRIKAKTLRNVGAPAAMLWNANKKSPAIDQAPPFASIARTPEFDANKLAILLLAPHPNMPKLALSRAEVSNLAEYILTLK